MVDVPEHRHCQMCGRVVPVERNFCSRECEEKFEKIIRRRKRLLLILYLAWMVILGIIIYAVYAT